MISLCIQELAEITGGRLHLGVMPPLGGGMEPIGRVVADVRDVQPGDVFWEMETAEQGAAARADDAFAQGALGAVVAGRHVEPWAGKFSVVVRDASWALWQLAAWSRRRFRGQLIAVTGGAGRATTTRMIDALLRERFVGSSPAHDVTDRPRLPLSMLALDASHDFAVVEYDADQLDEIEALSHLCCPDVAVINCLASDGAPDGELACGLEMLEALPDGGWAVLNGDIPRMRGLASCLPGRVLLVGQSLHCDMVASDVCTQSGELSFVADGVPFRVPVWGRHRLHSALAALAVGRIMNLSPDEMAMALSQFRPPKGCSREIMSGETF
jgi:UDP-N-acetylmuramoyl-tripeptide--D-alanyl-D-alanine ligase